MKQVVATFKKNAKYDFDFYEIVQHIDQYSLLKNQANGRFYLYDNDNARLCDMYLLNIPDNSDILSQLISSCINKNRWENNQVFFWADSPFVQNAFDDGKETLKSIFTQLVEIRKSNSILESSYNEITEEDGTYLDRLRIKMKYEKYKRNTKRLIRKLEREFKVIW